MRLSDKQIGGFFEFFRYIITKWYDYNVELQMAEVLQKQR